VIHDLRCQATGIVIGTIELPDDMPADEVLRRTYTQSGVYSDPSLVPIPVPEAASPATIRVALRRLHGVTNAQLDATVQAVLAGIADPGARDDAETLWMYSVSIRRDHPLVAAVAVAFNLTDAQTDEVFRVAATI
jgi:hypothetical protein